MKIISTLCLILLLSGCASGRELFVLDAAKLAIRVGALEYGNKNRGKIDDVLARLDEIIPKVDIAKENEVIVSDLRMKLLDVVGFEGMNAAEQLVVSDIMKLVMPVMKSKISEGSIPLLRTIDARVALEVFRDQLALVPR